MTAAVCVLLGILLGTLVVRETRSAQRRVETRTKNAVRLYAGFLQQASNRIAAHTEALRQFVLQETRDNTEIDPRRFALFASGLHASDPWILAMQIVRNGRIDLCYPLAGNEAVLGYDLLHDPRPSIRKDVQDAALTDTPVLTGPVQLLQGDAGIVIRRGVPGPASASIQTAVVLALDAMFEQAQIPSASEQGLLLAIRSGDGTLCFGEAGDFEPGTALHQLQMPGETWFVAGMPADSLQLQVVRVQQTGALSAFVILTLAGALAFFLSYHNQNLRAAVAEKTLALRTANGALRADVMLREAAQKALEHSEHRYRTLFEESSTALLVFDDHGVVSDANKAATRLLLGTSDAPDGLTAADLNWPVPCQIWPELPESGMSSRCERCHLQRADGIQLYVEITSTRLEPGRSLHAVRDLTSSLQTERALRDHEERMQVMADSLPLLVVYVDCHERVLYANATMKRWVQSGIGVLNEESIGKSLEEIYSSDMPDLYDQNKHLLRQALEGAAIEFSHEVRLTDGTLRYRHSVFAPHKNADGVVLGTYVLVADVTERVLARRKQEDLERQLFQAQKLEAVGRLAGGIAHDFNNMLQVIVGYAEIGPSLVPEIPAARQAFGEIHRAATRSTELTQQLLMFSRRLPASIKPIDIRTSVGDIIRMLQRIIGHAARVRFQAAEDIHHVQLDPAHLDQLLANLVLNSRDAVAGKGEITISLQNVSLTESDRPRDENGDVPADSEFVLLRVVDNGCGIPEEFRDRIFEPFFTTKDLGKGTGLGLATVYGIVTAHCGKILVDSSVGEGTQVSVYFPKSPVDALHGAVEDQNANLPGGSETILVVEDEPMVLTLTSLLLRKLGYHILTATSPAEAMGRLASGKEDIALLVTDVMMPGTNGLQLARRLRESLPGLKCLFISGFPGESMALDDSDFEELCFLSKPFSSRDIAERIRGILDGNLEGLPADRSAGSSSPRADAPE